MLRVCAASARGLSYSISGGGAQLLEACTARLSPARNARQLVSDTQSLAAPASAANAGARAAPTAKQAKLFQKVLDGDFKPPEDTVRPSAAAAAKEPSAVNRALGYLGNFIFYGGLVSAASFMAFVQLYSEEQVEQMDSRAQETRGEGGLAAARAAVTERLAAARQWYGSKVREFTDPGSDELLPDLLPFQRQVRMRTLVLDLDGVLVESVWQRRHGWKTVKRPGAEAFLENMAHFYELVVFSDRPHSYADPILNRVDPGIATNQGAMIMYRLYKNSTHWERNESMRDLTKLNRDLSQVVFVVSESRAHTVKPADNVLVIPDFKGADPDKAAPAGDAPQDTTLLDLVPLLELMWKNDVADTRVVCKSYAGKDVIAEFRARLAADVAPKAAASRTGGVRRRFGLA